MKIIDGTDMTSKKFAYTGLMFGFFIAAAVVATWLIIVYAGPFFSKILPILLWTFCGIIVVWIIIKGLLDIHLGVIGDEEDTNKKEVIK